MDLFVVAHEYAHVVRGDVPELEVVIVTRPGGTSTINLERLVRSWSKELMADILGYRLTLEALRQERASDPAHAQRAFLDASQEIAPLLYFYYDTIVAEAAELHEFGSVTPIDDAVWAPANALVALARAHAMNKPIDFGAIPPLTYPFSDHPPPWLRRACLQAKYREHLTRIIPDDQAMYAEMAEVASANLARLWKNSLGRIPRGQ